MADELTKAEGDDYLVLGSDSYTNPQKLGEGVYVEGMNLMNRGGLPQTRPGSSTVFTLPDGNFQGVTVFKPSSGIPHLVFMVNGLVYASPFPFTTYRQLFNLKFSLDARFAAWANCLKSTDYTRDGTLYFLDNPYSVLIIQDGLTRAGYWDGTNNGHLNPTRTGLYTSGATGFSIAVQDPISPEPTLTINPNTDRVFFGNTLSITAPLVDGATYQWNRGGLPILGETSNTLYFPSLQESNAGTYTVTVRILTNIITSPEVTLTSIALAGTVQGFDETPLGLWMKWSNNRLWISRKNQIVASDIGNPLKFTEAQYLNEGRAFYLPGDCTGIVETSDQQGILCFTDSTGTFIQSSIQDRTLWLSTPNFQKTVLPNTGCSSPRSIVLQYGLIWWYSARGLINLNDALRTNITSRLDIQDNEMFASKYNMSFDLSGVCGAFYENFLLQSIPNGDKYNTRTLVLDQAPFDGIAGQSANSWPSYWSGWRPIEWAKAIVDGEERLYFGSKDHDGKNRIWESFRSERTDNGTPISCYLITRDHLFGNLDFKKFLYSEIEMREIVGDLSVRIYVSGLKGAFQSIGTKEVVSTVGQIYAGPKYGFNANKFASSRPQSRIIRSISSADPSACNEECVESKSRGLIDRGFSLMIIWSGHGGLSNYRIFSEPYPYSYNGDCEDNEVAPRMVTPNGCGSLTFFNTSEPYEIFRSSFTATGANPLDQSPISYTASQFSFISQADADRKARLAAQAYVDSLIFQLDNTFS